MQKLKVGDEVMVLVGKDKGKTGKISAIHVKRKRVLVSGVNMAKKTVRPTQENPAGGISDIELPVHISNVAIVSPKNNKPSRVRIEDRDGERVRVAVSCGTVLS